MAKRPVFISDINEDEYVNKKQFEFEWFPGFAQSQKRISINSLHESFVAQFPSKKVLEVSSKSTEDLGVMLSAFNLPIKLPNGKEVSVESAFQASKVFENGGPYIDLLSKSSLDSKRDPRLKTSGDLKYFKFLDQKFELEPKTFFYDWVYINALNEQKELSRKVLEYDAFTDIEFNPQKSINCQAKSVALFVSLSRKGVLNEALTSKELFRNTAYKKILIIPSKEKSKIMSKENEVVIEQLKLDI